MSGRVDNIKYWLSRYPKWNVNRGNTLNGSTALHNAVYFGRNKIETVKVLVEVGGASLDVRNHGGASILANAVKSTDSNVDRKVHGANCYILHLNLVYVY